MTSFRKKKIGSPFFFLITDVEKIFLEKKSRFVRIPPILIFNFDYLFLSNFPEPPPALQPVRVALFLSAPKCDAKFDIH